MIGAGSILEIAQVSGAKAGLKVWGSGYMLAVEGRKFRNFPDFDFYAVRGELTRGRVHANRDLPLGDPGLLASRVYRRSEVVPGRVGLVYHYLHKKDSKVQLLLGGSVFLIDPLRDPNEVASDITSCEFVYSSSLHGLVVADAFGVPNAWTPFARTLGGGNYKFDDYYSAFGEVAVAHAPEIITDAKATHELERKYRGIPDLVKMQDDLIAAFPYEPSRA
ncbi:UNVERIFIED_ORG: polysaccharide pyruvyl transferase [Gordonia westfalica J30]